jgi:uncharacterized protein (DUF1778 family)
MTEKRTKKDSRVVISVPATKAQVDLITMGAAAANINLNDFIVSKVLQEAEHVLMPEIENRP